MSDWGKVVCLISPWIQIFSIWWIYYPNFGKLWFWSEPIVEAKQSLSIYIYILQKIQPIPMHETNYNQLLITHYRLKKQITFPQTNNQEPLD